MWVSLRREISIFAAFLVQQSEVWHVSGQPVSPLSPLLFTFETNEEEKRQTRALIPALRACGSLRHTHRGASLAAAASLSQQLFCVFPHYDWPRWVVNRIHFDAWPRPRCRSAPFHWLLYQFVLRDWPHGLVVKASGLHSPFCDCSVECTGQ